MEIVNFFVDWICTNTNIAFTGLLLLLVTSFVTSFINATIGVGGGVLMLAMLLVVLPTEAVIPVHAVIQLLSNVGRTAAFRKSIEKSILARFAFGCVLGSIAAAFILINIPGWLLEVVIGLFIVSTLFGSSTKNSCEGNTNNYFAIGTATSFVSSFVGATGPLVIAFLNRETMSKETLIGTHGACMTIQHLLKLVAFLLVGIVVTKWLLLVALLGLAGFAGTLLGRKVLFALPENTFKALFKAGLVLLCINILGSASVAAAGEMKAVLSTGPVALGFMVMDAEITELHQIDWWKRLIPTGSFY